MRRRNIDIAIRSVYVLLPSSLGPWVETRVREQQLDAVWERTLAWSDQRAGRAPHADALADPITQLRLLSSPAMHGGPILGAPDGVRAVATALLASCEAVDVGATEDLPLARVESLLAEMELLLTLLGLESGAAAVAATAAELAGSDAADDPGAEVVPSASAAGVVDAPEDEGGAAPIGPVPFRAWSIHGDRARDQLDELGTRRARRELTDLAVEIVAVEHPITRTRLISLLAAEHGLARVRGARGEQIWKGVIRGEVSPDPGGFVWPRGTSVADHAAYRRGVLAHLRISEVHPRELDAVIVHARDATGSENQQVVLRAALVELGGSRMTEAVRDALEAAWRRVGARLDR